MRSITNETPLNRAVRKQQRPTPDMTRLEKVIACGVVRLRLQAVLRLSHRAPTSLGSRYVEAQVYFKHLKDTEQR